MCVVEAQGKSRSYGVYLCYDLLVGALYHRNLGDLAQSFVLDYSYFMVWKFFVKSMCELVPTAKL